MPNSYFSFPYLASTSFPNAAACTSAASACAADYAACTADLGSGSGSSASAYGVTIVVPGGGGITVAPTQAAGSLGAAAVSSVCGSLSRAACFGLQSSVCSQSGTAGGTGFYVGTQNAAARPTAPPCAGVVVGAVAAGVGIGMMGSL